MKKFVFTNYDSTFRVEYLTDYAVGKELFTITDIKEMSLIEGHYIKPLDKTVQFLNDVKAYAVTNKLNLTIEDINGSTVISENSVELSVSTTTIDGGTKGTNQVETATIVAEAGITTAGDMSVTITSALFEEDLVISVAVALEDTDAEVSAKVKTALELEAEITENYTVSVDGADFGLTALVQAEDDVTLNIAFDNDTCVGLTGDASSVGTTAGVAPTPYSEVLASLGGNGSARDWSIKTGSLPTGLSLNANTGVISGLPTVAGEITFTVQVSDKFTVAEKELSITIE